MIYKNHIQMSSNNLYQLIFFHLKMNNGHSTIQILVNHLALVVLFSEKTNNQCKMNRVIIKLSIL